jgi:hypothetical protein
MKKEVGFDFSAFSEGVNERSVDVLVNVRLLDDMVAGLISDGISALDFSILTEENLEQYRYAHSDNHDCIQLIRRFGLLPSTKFDEYNILF